MVSILGKKLLWGRSLRLAVMALALALALLPLMPSHTALAHPLGNFTINRYARVEISSHQIRVRYVLDMAEIPTFQEMERIDRDRDSQVSEGEGRQYVLEKVEALRRRIQLIVNRKPVELRPVPESQELAFPTGQAGLKTLRLSTWFEAPVSQRGQGEKQYAVFTDNNYADRIGWKEIIIRPTNGVSLLQSTVPSEDVSNGLLNYPQDLLSTPLNIQQATFSFEMITPTPNAWGNGTEKSAPPIGLLGVSASTGSPLLKADSRLASLIGAKRLTTPVLLFSLLAATLWGAMHAFTPGHGKTIVALYLVGSQATFKHAGFLGLSVAVTHTLAVFALGLVTLFASRYVLPERLFPWIQLTSCLLVAGLGIWLVQARLRNVKFGAKRLWQASSPGPAISVDDPDTCHHGHREIHAHDSDHDHDHAETEHAHPHFSEEGAKTAWKRLLALGVSGGLLPCPSAILLMLSAISLSRIGLGLALVVAFSVGLACTLTGVGVLVLYGQRVLRQLKLWPTGSVPRFAGLVGQLFPVGSAFVICLVGILLTAQALSRF